MVRVGPRVKLVENRLVHKPEDLGVDYNTEPTNPINHRSTKLLRKAQNTRLCEEGWMNLVYFGVRDALCKLPDCELDNSQLSDDSDFGGSSLMEPVSSGDRPGPSCAVALWRAATSRRVGPFFGPRHANTLWRMGRLAGALRVTTPPPCVRVQLLCRPALSRAPGVAVRRGRASDAAPSVGGACGRPGLAPENKQKLCSPKELMSVLKFYNDFGTHVVVDSTWGGSVEQHFTVQQELVDKTTQVSEPMPVDRVIADILEQYSHMQRRSEAERERVPTQQETEELITLKRGRQSVSERENYKVAPSLLRTRRPATSTPGACHTHRRHARRRGAVCGRACGPRVRPSAAPRRRV